MMMVLPSLISRRARWTRGPLNPLPITLLSAPLLENRPRQVIRDHTHGPGAFQHHRTVSSAEGGLQLRHGGVNLIVVEAAHLADLHQGKAGVDAPQHWHHISVHSVQTGGLLAPGRLAG